MNARCRSTDAGWRCGACLCLCAIVLSLDGCAKTKDYLDVMQEEKAACKEIAEILEKVHDEKSMTEAKGALDERLDRFEAIARRARSLPPPSQAVKERMEEEGAGMKFWMEQMINQASRVRKLKPGGEEFMKYFSSKSPGLAQAIQNAR